MPDLHLALVDLTSLIITLPGGGVIRLDNLLDSDDGIAQLEVLAGKCQEITRYPLEYDNRHAGENTTLTIYGPHAGEPGHYSPDGSQEE